MKEHYKAVSETGVKSDPAFCLGPTIKKTNSGAGTCSTFVALCLGECIDPDEGGEVGEDDDRVLLDLEGVEARRRPGRVPPFHTPGAFAGTRLAIQALVHVDHDNVHSQGGLQVFVYSLTGQHALHLLGGVVGGPVSRESVCHKSGH